MSVMIPMAADETGRPEDDLRSYRSCLGQFGTGITIVTAETAAGRAGTTANSFASLSLDPPLVMWAIDRKSRSFPVFGAATHFAVNILASDQLGLSQRFASKETDKFAGVAWRPGEHGSPVLDATIAVFECRTEVVQDAGDHALIIGRVTRYVRRRGTPLLYVQGAYSVAEPHPSTVALPSSRSSTVEPVGESFATLVFQAHNALSSRFEACRQARGISVNHARVLTGLLSGAGSTVEAVARAMVLTLLDARSATQDLVDRGYATLSPDGTVSVTASGLRLAKDLRDDLAGFERDELAGLPPQSVAATMNVLRSVIGRADGSRP